MLFPVENFHFGRPIKDFSRFGKLKSRKKGHLLILELSLLPFSIFHLPFYNFHSFLLHFPPFPFFPCLFFPGRSAEISWSEVSGGTLPPPPPPPPVTPLHCRDINIIWSPYDDPLHNKG